MGKTISRNHKAWLQIYVLVFLRYQAFQTNKLKRKTKTFIIRILSRNHRGQLNIKLPQEGMQNPCIAG